MRFPKLYHQDEFGHDVPTLFGMILFGSIAVAAGVALMRVIA